MARYLVTGVDRDGVDRTEWIEADSMDVARWQLEVRGWTGIAFHTDAVSDAVEKMNSGVAADAPEWTAEDELAARRRSLGASLLHAVAMHAIFWAPLAIWAWISVRGGRPYGWGDKLGFGLLGLWALWFTGLSVPMALYDRILHAGMWNRWGQQRGLILLFRTLGWLLARNPAIRQDLDFRLAFGEAARGRWDAAELRVLRYSDPVAMEPALYLSRYASMCDYARRFGEAIAARRRVTELTPDSSSAWIDLAQSLIKDAGDAAGAWACLDRAAGLEVTEMAKPFVDHVEALLALHGGRPDEARTRWERAIPAALQQGSSIVVGEFVTHMKAGLALAYARLGVSAPARNLFAQARPLLVAQRENQLLQLCREAGLG